MTVGYLLLLGTVTIFGGAAVFAFWWAVRTGQFNQIDRQSTSIFGPDEPIGEMTDDLLGPTKSKPIPEALSRRMESRIPGGRS